MNNNKNYQTLKDLENENPLEEQLKQLIPEAFLDGELNVEILQSALNKHKIPVTENKSYGLQWVGKNQTKDISHKSSNKTLKPIKEKSLNFDSADNIVIEGDNLEVLKIITKSYHNQIDVIYIDPPYNNTDEAIYDDDSKKMIINKNNKHLHTRWLNMIYPRLILTRNLLKDTGIIFISIDDNEYARLKLICDEIFGEENFISSLVWIKKHGAGIKNRSKQAKIINNSEHILCYAKNISKINLNKNACEEFPYEDQYVNERGKYKTVPFDENVSEFHKYKDELDYTIIAPDKSLIILNKNNEKTRKYSWPLKIFIKANQLGFIEFKNEKNNWKIFKKVYEKITFNSQGQCFEKQPGLPYENTIGIKTLDDENDNLTKKEKNDIFKNIKNFFKNNDSKEINQIFDGNNVYVYNAKPKNLIMYLLKIASKKDSTTILDFFAGSGTTAQAVMELNKEDGGNRKYILVQFPEEQKDDSKFKTTCDIITTRIKRSIELFDYKDKGFKYFQVSDSNFSGWVLKEQYEEEIKEHKITPEGMLYELLLMIGLPLNCEIIHEKFNNHKYWTDEFHEYLFLLDWKQNIKDIINIIKLTLEKNKNETNLRVYISEKYFEVTNGDEQKINLTEQIKILFPKIKLFIY